MPGLYDQSQQFGYRLPPGIEATPELQARVNAYQPYPGQSERSAAGDALSSVYARSSGISPQAKRGFSPGFKPYGPGGLQGALLRLSAQRLGGQRIGEYNEPGGMPEPRRPSPFRPGTGGIPPISPQTAMSGGLYYPGGVAPGGTGPASAGAPSPQAGSLFGSTPPMNFPGRPMLYGNDAFAGLAPGQGGAPSYLQPSPGTGGISNIYPAGTTGGIGGIYPGGIGTPPPGGGPFPTSPGMVSGYGGAPFGPGQSPIGQYQSPGLQPPPGGIAGAGNPFLRQMQSNPMAAFGQMQQNPQLMQILQRITQSGYGQAPAMQSPYSPFAGLF